MSAHDWGYRHVPTRRKRALSVPARARRRRLVGGQHLHRAARAAARTTTSGPRSGCASGRWEQCLPAFKRLERDLDVDNEWHGQDGPLAGAPPPAERVGAVAGGVRRGLPRARLSALRRQQRARHARRRPARDEQDRRPADQRGGGVPDAGGAARARTCDPRPARSCGACCFARPQGDRRRGRRSGGRRDAARRTRGAVRGRDQHAGHPAALGRRSARRGRATRLRARGRRARGRRDCSITPARRSSCARAGVRRRRSPRPADPDRAAVSRRAAITRRHDAAARLEAARCRASTCRSSA